jgi:hypothetical protein
MLGISTHIRTWRRLREHAVSQQGLSSAPLRLDKLWQSQALALSSWVLRGCVLDEGSSTMNVEPLSSSLSTRTVP